MHRKSRRLMKGSITRTKFLEWVLCPFSKDPMHDPVVCADGHTYERLYITAWMLKSEGAIGPMTGLSLPSKVLTPNHFACNIIEQLTNGGARSTPRS
eukprot:scaffold169821_cov31-Tisochrysis_lutea.AAC.1